ncbi:Isochorismatase family protein [Candidatus Bilamarchaeum dharawalense]|uniref:Isochorismatase family protein n=1 Tax=Candidatus Bilamarchaeum dharawalense TaxID=2885759 RepID=A0A5E4LP45_9ARCH|nr:Isochorismatase family protein [Candidatus Bilamarchaeum dharawalense]
MRQLANPIPTRSPSDRKITPGKFGMVIIDMLDQYWPPDTRPFKYDFGPVSLGIKRLCGLLDFALKHNIPIIIVESYSSDAFLVTIPEITDRVESKARIMSKKGHDAFLESEFRSILKELDLVDLVVGGYDRSICVFQTSRSLVTNGFRVFTSPEVLFGDDSLDLRHPDLVGAALEFYKSETVWFETYRELLSTLRSSQIPRAST